MVLPDQSNETRQRLLEAAGEVFAERGFQSATVRDICQRAGANVAAVNYHFGDKERLYLAVVKHARTCVMADFERQLPPAAPAEERLRAFVQAYLLRIFDPGRPSWHGKLLAREMVEPTKALDEFVEEQIRPNHLRLKALVAEIMGIGADDEVARLASFSIMAQCLYHYHCRAVVSRLYPARPFTAETVSQLADHITRFSLSGLRGLKS